MIPKVLDKFEAEIGLLPNCISGIAIEERNGMCEIEVTYPIFSSNWESLKRGNIIVADVNDTLKNQKFRIYRVSKPINGKIAVYARHIFFDLARDIIEGFELEGASCEYALNELFRRSQFSNNFKGYSDIINAQNYKISTVNLVKAIGGTQGSILDTYGTRAEILRDNRNVHVLNRRGHDNGVTIEYAKNMTGLDIDYDDSDLITRIKPIAKYTDENNNEILVESNPRYVDSPKIGDYETPFVQEIDFSDKFNDNEKPTPAKLKTLAENYFRDNKCDEVKVNIKVEFIPLSKCLGYEHIQDQISLCDTVAIKDYRYKLDTQAKVIKTYYDFLAERYDKMELGEPRTSLGDIVGGGSGEGTQGPQGPPGQQGPQGPPGPPGADGNLGDFPNSLPATPILSYKVYGFANIELSWTFENKVYYSYELYASKTKGFTPNTFDLIHAGQSSSFLFQAKPNETWYFKVCAINSYGNRTFFSNEVSVTTKKIDDFEDYFSTLAVGNLVASMFTADYMEAGIIKGNWIDAKQLSVTDGNGKRTFYIDSFGNVNLDVTSLSISAKAVATQSYADTKKTEAINSAKSYTNTQITEAKAAIKITTDSISSEVSKKVNSNQIISSINQTAESVKIKANKIQLEGSTTIGDSENRHVKIDKANYSIYRGDRKLGYFGVVDDEKDGHPKLTLGHNGIRVENDDYLTLHAYGGGGNNAEGNSSAYCDFAYHSIKYKDWSNIKMYADGQIKLAPLTNLEITTNSVGGAYVDGSERRLCLFDTSKSQYFNSNLQIPALRNMTSDYGLILADDHIGGGETRVRVQYDGSNRFFRPLTGSANISLGSAGYKWASLHVANGVSYSVEDSEKTRMINTIDESIDTVLDSLDFNMNIHRSRSNSSQDLRLNLDVAELKQHPLSGIFLNIEEDYNEDTKENETHVSGDMASLLHLALYELQKQKEEIKFLKQEIENIKNRIE